MFFCSKFVFFLFFKYRLLRQQVFMENFLMEYGKWLYLTQMYWQFSLFQFSFVAFSFCILQVPKQLEFANTAMDTLFYRSYLSLFSPPLSFLILYNQQHL